jgi:hypothetical protein
LKALGALKVTFIVLLPLGAFGLLSASSGMPAGAAGVSQITLSCSSPPPESASTNGCSVTTTNAQLPGSIYASSTGTYDFFGGFWIWCQGPAQQGTPYGPDCSGSTYIEEVNLTTSTGVYDATHITGTSSEGGPTGVQVTFTTSDDDMTCTLDVPSSPTHGASNSLSGTCDGQSITFGSVVVGT